MLRIIGAVVLGYLATFVILFLLFCLAFFVIGVEGSYQPGTYDVSTLWIGVSFAVGLVSAVAAGYLAAVVGKTRTAAYSLAVFLFVLGIVSAVGMTLLPVKEAEARPANVSLVEAMEHSRSPLWIEFVHPFLGVVGAACGGLLRKQP